MSFDKTGTEGRRLYIGGLPFSVDERDLEDLCEKYGKIEDAFIVKDKYSDVPKSRGFGFVTFKDKKDAEDCIDALHKTCLQDREITVQVARNNSRGGGRGGGRRDYRDGGYRGGSRSYGGGGGGYRGSSYSSSSRGGDRGYDDRDRRYDDRDRRYDDRDQGDYRGDRY